MVNTARQNDCACFFFFNDTATTEIYTLSLHDALPISNRTGTSIEFALRGPGTGAGTTASRSEEHTSELQSQSNLVCRLLLEKKKKNGTLCRSRARIFHATRLGNCSA